MRCDLTPEPNSVKLKLLNLDVSYLMLLDDYQAAPQLRACSRETLISQSG